MAKEPKSDESPPPRVHFRAHCPTCLWTGRPFQHIAHADDAAKDHANIKKHVTHVIDHYKLRVTGTTHRPATLGEGSGA